jgi:ferritin-like metal-binding protein YciE
MKASNLQELYIAELRDLYDAENQLTHALPKMAKAASHTQLQAAFKEHLGQTESHIQRLDVIFQNLGVNPKGKPCKAMKGLIAEGEEMIKDTEQGARDAGLIAAAQKVEHYEMAGYGCARTWAQMLGHTDAANLLQMTLNEEAMTDERLTRLAESVVNVEAEHSR